MARTWEGNTSEAGSAILGAGFWKPGAKLDGIFVRAFVTKLPDGTSGECFQFLLMNPQTITINVNENGKWVPDGEGKPLVIDKFAIGALTGFEMALDALKMKGFERLQTRDKVHIECTGITRAKERGMSDMPEFLVRVER